MNSSAAAASPVGGPTKSNLSDDIHALHTGLELTRASQLTLLRFQLALQKSNRRAAMQALDSLLDIDAEMAGLASTLRGVSLHVTADPLSAFIGLQREAIAGEKHALTGGILRCDSPAIVAPKSSDEVAGADLPAQPMVPVTAMDSNAPSNGRRWMLVVAVAIVVPLLGCGLIAYLWPASVSAVISF